MKKRLFIGLLPLLVFSCQKTTKSTNETSTISIEVVKPQTLSIEEATRLSKLPLECLDIEYPNRLGQTLSSANDIQSPKALHPAFYGCFDWHSSVHGHWSLVRLLNKYPEIEQADNIKKALAKHLTKENIATEVRYFDGKMNKSYERTYGWTWLLKLQEELDKAPDAELRALGKNLQPLSNRIIEGYKTYLPKLVYPIRIGEHTNTAFGLAFAYDYAQSVGHTELKELIEKSAKRFYTNDADCPINWEPSGYDFLSPCLQEAFLMSKLLPKEEYKAWLSQFLPQLSNKNFTLKVGIVGDRQDAKLVHLDGVNFSRAWCLNAIAEKLPEDYSHLKNEANKHISHSLPSITDGNYEGTHWLASFALYALDSK